MLDDAEAVLISMRLNPGWRWNSDELYNVWIGSILLDLLTFD
jgi:hypothetical protein